MRYIDFDGNKIESFSKQDKFLEMIYTHKLGRILIKPFTHPVLSNCMGRLCDSGLSKIFIASFVKRNHIDMAQFENKKYRSYNDFFSRRIKDDARPLMGGDESLISPSDGKVGVYAIEQNLRFKIKHTEYTVEDLLKDQRLAEKYKAGYLIIIRLTVDDYHRYCYCASGRKETNHVISGALHTVNPIANDYVPIYKENARSYTIIHSEHFGDVLQMEVGALCVGRIVNYHEKKQVCRGEEKGRFEFGGSTVILMVERNYIQIIPSLITNTDNGFETHIRMGEILGKKRV